MFFLPIILSSSITHITYDEYINQISSLEKCMISGIVNEVSIEVIPSRFSNLYTTINGKEGIYYRLEGTIDLTGDINGAAPTYSEHNLPKLGDNIDYLVYKHTDDDYYHLLSDKKINDNEYHSGGMIFDYEAGFLQTPNFKGDFKYCEADEKYIKNSEVMNFKNGNNLYFSYTSNGEIVMFLNDKIQLSQKALTTRLSFMEKVISIRNKEYIENVIPNIESETLIEAYNNFLGLDLSGLGIYREFINYLGNMFGLEIYKRFANV